MITRMQAANTATETCRQRTDSKRLTAADAQFQPGRRGEDTFTLMMTPIALMGLMLLSLGVVSAMGQLGF